MTREEAIAFLSMIEFEQAECCLNTWYKGIDDDMKEALKMAIEALEQEPVYYPPCIDCNKKMNEIRNAYDNITTKALEQESILDKIREEIEHEMIEAPYMYDDEHFDELYSYQDGLKDALHIIDKHSGESEDAV